MKGGRRQGTVKGGRRQGTVERGKKTRHSVRGRRQGTVEKKTRHSERGRRQDTVERGRRQGRQKKRWEDFREWTCLEFGKSQKAVKKKKRGGEWRKLVVKSAVVPRRPSRLGCSRWRWRWRWRWMQEKGEKNWRKALVKTGVGHFKLVRWNSRPQAKHESYILRIALSSLQRALHFCVCIDTLS